VSNAVAKNVVTAKQGKVFPASSLVPTLLGSHLRPFNPLEIEISCHRRQLHAVGVSCRSVDEWWEGVDNEQRSRKGIALRMAHT
jgi:hypothetical protein